MPNSETIRAREEIPQEDKWTLEDLFASDEAWEAGLAAVLSRLPEVSAFTGKLSESGKTLFDFLSLLEELDGQLELLGNYAMRKADEDTRNATYQAMSGKFIGVATNVSAAFSFSTPEIMDIQEETLESFFAACPQLERYRRHLTDLRRRKAHTLSAQEERLLPAAGEMANAPDSIYGALTDADMQFPKALDAEGQPHALSQSTFVPL